MNIIWIFEDSVRKTLLLSSIFSFSYLANIESIFLIKPGKIASANSGFKLSKIKLRNRYKKSHVTRSKYSPIKSRPVWTNAYGNIIWTNRKKGKLTLYVLLNCIVTRNGISHRWLSFKFEWGHVNSAFLLNFSRGAIYMVLKAFLYFERYIIAHSCRQDCLQLVLNTRNWVYVVEYGPFRCQWQSVVNVYRMRFHKGINWCLCKSPGVVNSFDSVNLLLSFPERVISSVYLDVPGRWYRI